jgi:hypothetical protein
VLLSEKIRTATEIKALQLEEKALQAHKTTRQALLEPLQEKAEQVVMESDVAKRRIEQIRSEGGEILKSPITEKVVTVMDKKSSQAHQQSQWIMKIYDALKHEVTDAGSS